MFDTFSAFGTIMSCKVATDDKGKSKGYGFVHFETEAAAMNAIDKVNGMALNQKKVFVGKFIPRTERARELGDKAKVFSNVYIKNFDDEMTEEKLYEVFSKYGEVTSHKVAFSDDGKNKGFGFVAFKDSDSAEQAVQDLNNSDWNGKTMYVGRAQKKSERMAELKKKFDALKQDRMSRNAGVNLYIKNLDDSIDDERLRSEFNPYGTITSAKVMTDEGQRSRGFGFVCFNLPDEATRAGTEMNGRILVSKPLYVALAQRREDRKAQLASQYMDRITKIRMQTVHNQAMYTPNAAQQHTNTCSPCPLVQPMFPVATTPKLAYRCATTPLAGVPPHQRAWEARTSYRPVAEACALQGCQWARGLPSTPPSQLLPPAVQQVCALPSLPPRSRTWRRSA